MICACESFLLLLGLMPHVHDQVQGPRHTNTQAVTDSVKSDTCDTQTPGICVRHCSQHMRPSIMLLAVCLNKPQRKDLAGGNDWVVAHRMITTDARLCCTLYKPQLYLIWTNLGEILSIDCCTSVSMCINLVSHTASLDNLTV